MSIRDKVDSFVKDGKIQSLIKSLREPNFFSILKLENYEIRHSNFLAWLLDPNENHEIGDIFLRKILNELGFEKQISSSIKVYREWKNIDLLIVDKDNQWVVAIENKIYSSQHSGQLQRYKDIVENSYASYEQKYVYLKEFEEEDISDDWQELKYESIYKILNEIKSVNEEVDIFIKHYKKNLEKVMGLNSEEKKMCLNLYKEYKEIFDAVYKHKNKNLFGDEKFCKKIRPIGYNQDTLTNSIFRFYPEKWENIDKLKIAKGWTNTNRFVLFEYKVEKNKRLMFYFFVGPVGDENKKTRKDLIEQLRKSIEKKTNPERVNERYQNLEQKFVAIIAEEVLNLEDKSYSNEEIEQAINNTFKNLEQDINKIIEEVDCFIAN